MRLFKRFIVSACILPAALSIPSPRVSAGQAVPQTKLNAVLVLSEEFCHSNLKRGNGWTSVKEEFDVGEDLCHGLAESLSPVFASLSRQYEVPAPGAGETDIILIPKVGDIGATQKIYAFSNRELVVILEWTVLDRSGKTLWVGTIEASAKRHMGNAFTHGKNMRKIREDVVADAVRKSVEAIGSVPGLMNGAAAAQAR